MLFVQDAKAQIGSTKAELRAFQSLLPSIISDVKAAITIGSMEQNTVCLPS